MPPMPEHTGGGVPAGQPADLLTRFLARLIDGTLIGTVATVVVVTILFGAIFDTATGLPFVGGSNLDGFFASVLSTALAIAYFAYLESTLGQTVGKMIMKIEVRDPAGGHPSLEAALKRNVWMALSIIPFVGGLAQLVAAIAIGVTINNSRSSAGWHDKLAGGTRVVKV